jgi:hypothetical protein
VILIVGTRVPLGHKRNDQPVPKGRVVYRSCVKRLPLHPESVIVVNNLLSVTTGVANVLSGIQPPDNPSGCRGSNVSPAAVRYDPRLSTE